MADLIPTFCAEDEETCSVSPSARMVPLAQEALVNDDLSAFSDLAADAAVAAADKPAKSPAALLELRAGG